jgi:hypothetical protein
MVRENSVQQLAASVPVLKRMFENIIQNPEEPRFKTLTV